MGFNTLLPTNSIGIIRGTSKTLKLTVLDDKQATVDITGARILFSVKRRLEDTVPLIQKDSAASVAEIALIQPQVGVAEIYINPADTQNQDLGDYFFDVWAILASGKRYAVVPPSTFEVLAGVTLVP